MCFWTSPLVCLRELWESPTHNLCSDWMEMEGRISKAYCQGSNSGLIKGALCRTEKLNSTTDFHDVCYSKRRWKHRSCLHTLSSQKQPQFQQRFCLQFMLLEKASPELKGFCRGQRYNSLTCYTQEGSLAQKPLKFASSRKKWLPLWIFIERNRLTQIDMKNPTLPTATAQRTHHVEKSYTIPYPLYSTILVFLPVKAHYVA